MSKILGTASKPRVTVYKSNTAMYCSLRNDCDNKILATISSKNIDKKKNCNKEKAKKLGELLGDSLKKLNIKEIVFDRGKYLYHGKVMALAEGIREKEIIF